MSIRPLLLAAFVAAPLAGMPVAAATATASTDSTTAAAAKLVAEGTALHDAGQYDEAIARYRQTLALDPDNAIARYAIAFSYAVKKDYARCVEAARDALQHPRDQEARLYSVGRGPASTMPARGTRRRRCTARGWRSTPGTPTWATTSPSRSGARTRTTRR